MKIIFKRIFVLLTIFLVVLISSCNGAENNAEAERSEYNITLTYGDGRESKVIKVGEGETATVETPAREGYSFVGWCTDEKLTNFYDFTAPLNKDLTLYAKWDIDYKHLLARVASEASSSVVKIVSNAGAFGVTKQGSGVIFKQSENKYLALTNNHVVRKDNGAVATSFTVIDVYGNAYSAELLKSDPAYDLALLSFTKKSSVELKVSQISARLPEKNETVVTVSAPNGKINTVELANMGIHSEVDNETSSIEGVSDVDFKVLWLSGNADHGSSGGAVFDTELKLVGIIYGNIEIKETETECTIAIPAEKVIEFLGEAYQ